MIIFPLSKHFIENGIKLMQITEYLRSELVRAGFAGIDPLNNSLEGCRPSENSAWCTNYVKNITSGFSDWKRREKDSGNYRRSTRQIWAGKLGFISDLFFNKPIAPDRSRRGSNSRSRRTNRLHLRANECK